MRQPINNLAPFRVTTDSGAQIFIDDQGLNVDSVTVTTLRFGDGSKMITAGAGLPSTIDSGTF
jgi:hypothetical protein